MRPALAEPGGYRVALIGEALGKDERDEGAPFVGRAGHKLTRLIEWAGLDRAKFDIYNSVWCRPPDNRLDGASYEQGAVSHCKAAHWERLLARADVLVPMGNVPLAALTGRKGVLSTRGYIRPGPGTTHILPTVHPSFIVRGFSNYSRAWINDVQKAVELARSGLVIETYDYLLDPPPGVAYQWAKQYRESLRQRPNTKLAFDIETPGKKADEGEVQTEDDPTFMIWRVGFSYEGHKALSIPFTPEYLPAILLILSSEGDKVVWNASFDVPRLTRNGVPINGPIHDGMVAWHILHSDLPKGLGFVATFATPNQAEWKYLSTRQPAFYNATDADVELRSMWWIEARLREQGLWQVYQDDVLDLDPILVHMSKAGMPVDENIRYEKAVELATKRTSLLAEMDALVPAAIRKYDPVGGFVRTPSDTNGLVQIRVRADVDRCSICGMGGPTKPHFRTLKKPTAKRPQNPCAGGTVVTTNEWIERWARPVAFTPSRDWLIRYQAANERPVPTKKDKKTGEKKLTMDEQALKKQMKRYPGDRMYPAVIEFREVQKLAGTYVGYPDDGQT